jgi:hypothetical protein
MKFTITFLLGLTLCIAFALATVRLALRVAIRETEVILEKPLATNVSGKPSMYVTPKYVTPKKILDLEKILSGFGVPLNSTRFREDISGIDADPAIYFADKKAQQLWLAINAQQVG